MIVSASYLENVGCLHHLSHKGGDTLELGVTGPNTRQYTVHDGDGCGRTWHKTANLSHEHNHTNLRGAENVEKTNTYVGQRFHHHHPLLPCHAHLSDVG